MTEALDWLNNRDISMLIWFSLVLIFVLMYKPTRPNIIDVIKIIFTSQIGTIFLLCIAYTLAIILILHMNGYWQMSLTKVAIVWLFSFAFYSTFKFNEQKDYSQYFKKILWDAAKLTTLFEFATNFYVLSFLGELILVPFVSFIGMLVATSEHMQKEDKKYRISTKVFNIVLSCIGLYLLYNGIMNFIYEPHALLSWLSLNEFILPIILTIFFVPLLYAIAFYMHFESFAIRLFYLLKNDKKLAMYAKWKMLLKSHFNIDKLKRLEDRLRGKVITSKNELNLLFST